MEDSCLVLDGSSDPLTKDLQIVKTCVHGIGEKHTTVKSANLLQL